MLGNSRFWFGVAAGVAGTYAWHWYQTRNAG
jgi:hypothetical protein